MRLMTAELKVVKIYMLFTRREVRIGKNCAPCFGYRPRHTAYGGKQYRGHSFSQYRPTLAGE